MEKRFKVSVGGLLIEKGKALVVRRSDKEDILKGYYELPGGGVDFGERPEQALEREYREETGLNVKTKKPFRVFTYFSSNKEKQTVEIVYMVESLDTDRGIRLSEEHDDYRWITPEEMETLKMTDEIKANIREGFALLKN